MEDPTSPRNSSNWTGSEDEEIRELQAKLKEHAKAKASIRNSSEDEEQRSTKSLTRRVFRKKKTNSITEVPMSSSPASPATPKVRVDVSVHVEGAENLQCKHSDFNMRVILRDITLSELLHKIGKQAEFDLLKSNTLYGEANFNLIHVGLNGHETKLDTSSRLSVLIHNKDRLILRKKKHEQIAVSVVVEDYEELACANKVGFLFFKDLVVKEALHKICRKASINIPLDEEDNFELRVNNEALDSTKTLESYNIQNRSTISLKRKFLEENVTLSICIEDYKDLKCEKKIKYTINRNATVTELLDKLVEKSKSETLKSDIHKYDLVIINNNCDKMWRGKVIRDFLLDNYNILILRRKSAAEILMESTGLIRQKDIELTEKIGGGTFGKVYKGLFLGMAIAVKVLRENPEAKELEFKREVALLRNLRHPHIVNFFGTVEEENKLCIVMELCEKGSLYHVMNNDTYEIGWDRALKFCLESSEGLHFLHSLEPAILHRDLKSLNLLVTDSWQIKLCDFGLSRPQLSDYNSTLKKMRSTPAWCAPELMREQPYTMASDIYALGMVFWEIIVRCIRGRYEKPYGEYKDIIHVDYQILMQASQKKLRPTIPASCPSLMAELIKNCLLDDPNERPNTARLVASFREMRDDYAKNAKNWDQSIVHVD